MKKLALLLPLLAIAPLVAARAADPATNTPAASDSHAENAESAETDLHAEGAE